MSEETTPANTEKNTDSLAPEFVERIWKPGQSGNPSGRPKKKPITELYERLMEEAETMEDTAAALRKMLKKPNMAMVLQLKEMADRTEGKVAQKIDADVNVSNLAEAIAEARKRAGK